MATKHIDYEGFSTDIDMEVFDDVRFFEIADKLEEKPALNIEIVKLGLGEKEYDRFEKFFTKLDGKFKMSRVMGMVVKLFEEAGPKD